ncbi:hypothetical protein [Gorillibacterium massiliense]|uniref:hypothetical protein n=1 Tax=Gorillibacterium massiliense TaxID=1280390 RepID=UPI0004B376AB|nr:hypothetical protein [Gorillibacterium massiliense]
MKGSLIMALKRSTSIIRQLITFLFVSIFPGTSVVTRSFRVIRLVNRGEVIVSQRRATGTATPIVRFQFINAVTGVPVTNSVTVTGTRTVVLPFVLPSGTFRLRVTNIGASNVRVEGVILVF